MKKLFPVVAALLSSCLVAPSCSAQDYPPGTPANVIAAMKRMQLAGKNGTLPKDSDITTVQNWAMGVTRTATSGAVAKPMGGMGGGTSSIISEGIKGTIEVQFSYTRESPDGGSSQVTFHGVSPIVAYANMSGAKNYYANFGDPAAKVSSLEFATPVKGGPPTTPGCTFTRKDTDKHGQMEYHVKVSNMVVHGLLTSTGLGNKMWPQISVGAVAKGTADGISDGNPMHSGIDGTLPSEIEIPLGWEGSASTHETDTKAWVTKQPAPLAVIEIPDVKAAVDYGTQFGAHEHFTVKDGTSKYTGDGSFKVTLGGGCDAEPSGPQWIHRYPDHCTLDDLRAPFAPKAKAFVDALTEAGATVHVNSVFRPIQRSYLMHYSYTIAKGIDDPRHVPVLDETLYNQCRDKIVARGCPASLIPPYEPVDICWCHGGKGSGFDLAKSKAAADAMRTGYHIAYQPAWPLSHHNERLAMDLSISWTGVLKIKNAAGTKVSIGAPENGDSNQELWTVGASYGVIKNKTDPPHWSVDGG